MCSILKIPILVIVSYIENVTKIIMDCQSVYNGYGCILNECYCIKTKIKKYVPCTTCNMFKISGFWTSESDKSVNFAVIIYFFLLFIFYVNIVYHCSFLTNLVLNSAICYITLWPNLYSTCWQLNNKTKILFLT